MDGPTGATCLFVRRLGFDELPQLINVLRGDMSLIGPRPVVYEEELRERHVHVKAGMVSWSELSTDPEEARRRDIDYHVAWSLGKAVRALWITIRANMLTRRDR